METEQQSRLVWVDVLRGIAILLVLIAHRNTLPGVRTYINSFHIPLFFAISGYLFDPKKHVAFSPFARRRARRLLVPYVFFSLLALPFEVGYAITRSIPLDGAWILDLTTRFFSIHGGTLRNPPIWFLLSLFSVELAYFWIARLRSVRLNIVVLVTLSVCGYIFASWLFPFPKYLFWKLNFSLILLPFYGMGNLLRRSRFPRLGSPAFFTALAISLAIGLWLQSWSKHQIYFYLQTTPLYFVSFHAVAIASIIVFFALARSIERSSFLETCGQNTILLFGLHFLIYYCFEFVHKHFFLLDLPESITSAYIIITTLALILSCTGLVRTYLPWLFGQKR